MRVRSYKLNGRYVCYIMRYDDTRYIVKTGRPSDRTCLSWEYTSLLEADVQATSYLFNHVSLTRHLKTK